MDAHGPFPGGSGASVSITNPGNQAGIVGTPVSLQIQASDTDGGALSYSATGLPAGLSIDSSTGLISGTSPTAGTSNVTVRATDATGPSQSTSFAWTVNSGGTPPSTDRQSVNIPQVPQALWTEPMGDEGAILPAQDGSLITTKCSYHSSRDADVPYTLQQVASDGSLGWRRGSDNSDCRNNVRDSAGNDYYLMSDNAGAHVRSVNAQGWVRWTTAPLSNNIAGWSYGPPTLGANGDVYFTVYNAYGVGYLLGVDETTGVVTVDQVLGFPLAIYAYSGGLVVADGSGTVEYLHYDGSTQASYNVSGIDFTAASFAGGASGTIFRSWTRWGRSVHRVRTVQRREDHSVGCRVDVDRHELLRLHGRVRGGDA